MTSPWTRGFMVRWLPTPRIYDRRSHLIELFEEQFGVLRFKVNEDGVTLVLNDATEVSISVRRLSMHTLNAGDALRDADQMGRVAAIVAEALEPQPVLIRYAYQHLIAWPAADDRAAPEIFAAASHAVLSPIADAVDLLDSAVLVDGRRPSGGDFQIEFGVIDGDQAPLRLGRMLGRATGHRVTQHDAIMARSYPSIATFVDSTWPIELGEDWSGELPQIVHDELIRSDDEADEVALNLHRQLQVSMPVKGSK